MYELVIIGAGPAGLTAALYAARYSIKAVVLGKTTGGLIIEAHRVCNWPGTKEISGIELMKGFEEQLKALKVEIRPEEALDIKSTKKDNGFIVKTNKTTYKARAIILAIGTERKRLKIAGEEQLVGRGISYCATCDAAMFTGKNVAVVGGSNSAAMAAELLSKYAKRVYVIYRKDKMRAEPYIVKQLEKDKKIEFIYNANITEAIGDKFLQAIRLDNGRELRLEGLFIEIGTVPNKLLMEKLGIKTTEEGYVATDKKQRTQVKGVFAAGDITDNPLKQVVTAAAEGAIAAKSAYDFLRKEE